MCIAAGLPLAAGINSIIHRPIIIIVPSQRLGTRKRGSQRLGTRTGGSQRLVTRKRESETEDARERESETGNESTTLRTGNWELRTNLVNS